MPVRLANVFTSGFATNKEVLQSIIDTCEVYHKDCETCPYWVKKRSACIWLMYKIIGKEVMTYWDIGEIEEKEL